MTGKKWTLLVLTDERERLREITLGHRAVRTLLGGAGFMGIALVLLGGFFALRSSDAYRAAQLEQENALLAAELESIRNQVSGFQSVMEELVDRDAEVRIMAGLDPLDVDILRAGVGGPGAPNLDTHPLYAVRQDLGAESFAAAYDLHALERRALILRESLSEAADSLTLHLDILESTPSILPVEGRISSRFSSARFHPIHNRNTAHEGIDVPAPVGTPIRASARGRVIAAGRQAGYGLRVEIDHGHGITTLYAHASRILVRVGQEVQRGDVIAQVGMTGLTTSPHLHYEVRKNNRPVDPMNYIISEPVR
jgi:murein DD-endopeptidase MepM/ murein hydrolase activator NlpD